MQKEGLELILLFDFLALSILGELTPWKQSPTADPE